MYLLLKWLKVILPTTTDMHTTLLGHCLIIHRAYKNDLPFPLFCTSSKESPKEGNATWK